MASNNITARYRKLYTQLLRLYPKPYYERYAESMEQTFSDLLREREEEERGLFTYALWIFLETSIGIVKTNARSVIMQNKRIVRLLLVVGLLLMIPFVAMQFDSGVVWTLSDFVAMGILLLGAGLLYELGIRMSRSVGDAGKSRYRIAFGIAVAAGFFLTWINLAVGLIGSENNPANLLYGGVIGIGLIGALVARFRAQGMALTLLLTAIAQFLVPVIALLVWKQDLPPGEGPGIVGVFVLNFFFVTLWLASAWLFRNAANDSSGIGQHSAAM